MWSSSPRPSKQKQERGYNRIPLHPVYPFSACFALFTVCFWLAVYTGLPGCFHLLAGLTVVSLAVALACYLFAMTLGWGKDMRQRIVRGHASNKYLTKKMQERPSSRYLHQQRPRTNDRPGTKAFEAPDARGVPRAETVSLGERAYNLQHTEAEALRMNKLRVPFLDFLWVWCAPAVRDACSTRVLVYSCLYPQVSYICYMISHIETLPSFEPPGCSSRPTQCCSG